MATKQGRQKERRVTVVSKRRDWDNERFAQAVIAYVLSEQRRELTTEQNTDEASA